MGVRIAAVHTVVPTIALVGDIFKAEAPDVNVINLMDDGAIPDAVAAGGIEPNVTRRMCNLFLSAETAGAKGILLCWSTVGETADTGRGLLNVPLLRIDEAMAEEAVSLGKRIALVASVSSTLGPTERLLRRKAEVANKVIEVKQALADGALQKLQAGDAASHDSMVTDTVRAAAAEADVVVLAQASLTRVLPLLTDLSVPVLSSPRAGVRRILELVRNA